MVSLGAAVHQSSLLRSKITTGVLGFNLFISCIAELHTCSFFMHTIDHRPLLSSQVFLSLLLSSRVPAGEAVGLPQEGDALWQLGQTWTPYGQVLLG